ncbi:uncharacterized protein LOC109054866 [Tachysurus ichikawai]
MRHRNRLNITRTNQHPLKWRENQPASTKVARKRQTLSVLWFCQQQESSSYWKQSSRCFFAINEDVFAEMGRRKRRKLGQAKRHEESELLEIRNKIEEVLLASEGLPAVSAKLRELSKHSEGLTEQQSEILKTSFRCNVCRGVMNSPMLARCCHSLVGCRECVNAILQEGQGCVKCRSPITEESLVAVAGLSEVLNVIRAIEEQYTSV